MILFWLHQNHQLNVSSKRDYFYRGFRQVFGSKNSKQLMYTYHNNRYRSKSYWCTYMSNRLNNKVFADLHRKITIRCSIT